MIIIDGSFLLGIAGIITSIASFVKMVVVLRGPDAKRSRVYRSARDEAIAERRQE